MDYEAIKECTTLSDKVPFPEIVARLDAADVELYYADLLIPSKTYYSKNEAYALPFSLKSEKKVGTAFNADHVVQAIRQIQSGQIHYQEFLRQVMEAGVVSYFVFIKGAKAIYFGRLGEQHVEQFPSKK
jgi:uncharacterized protein YbcV (DUF1398 family)